MLFAYQNTTYNTETFVTLEEFNNWLNIFTHEVTDIIGQLDQNEYFKRTGSPAKSFGWVKGKQEHLKYVKTVKGQLEKLRNEVSHLAPPSKARIARCYMYVAQERLAIDVYNLILEEAVFMAENGGVP